MKHKVFISSTYGDLIPYRANIWEVISKLNNITIVGMEKFGARTASSLETCLAEVAASEIYVGIIAYRYGSVDKYTGKSYTQIEYEKALALGRHILIYLFDKEGFIQPKNIDFGENAKKLAVFKNSLKKTIQLTILKNLTSFLQKFM
ncbi:MAG TPA: DUF4062 domain-containing protein [Bacteroidales bacterium]|nr:DUF4062 domain-containing protein [Bacteroidales bacterium]